MSQKPPRFLCGALRQRKVKIDRRLIQNPAYGGNDTCVVEADSLAAIMIGPGS